MFGNHRIICVFFTIFLIILVSGCSILEKTTSNIQNVKRNGENFISLLKDHKFQQAEKYLTVDAQQKWSSSKLSNYLNAFEIVHGPIDKWSVQNFRVFAGTQGQSVSYTFKIDGKSAPGGILSMKLVQVSGSWHIDELAWQL